MRSKYLLVAICLSSRFVVKYLSIESSFDQVWTEFETEVIYDLMQKVCCISLSEIEDSDNFKWIFTKQNSCDWFRYWKNSKHFFRAEIDITLWRNLSHQRMRPTSSISKYISCRNSKIIMFLQRLRWLLFALIVSWTKLQLNEALPAHGERSRVSANAFSPRSVSRGKSSYLWLLSLTHRHVKYTRI